jgi:hypothetical protein
MAKALSASPPPTANGLDKLYHHLTEIHAIAVAQLAECACWRRSDSTPGLVQGVTGRQGANKMPSMTRAAAPPPTDFSPKLHYGGEAHMLSLRCDDGPVRWARSLSGMCGTYATVSPAAGGNTVMTLRGQGLRCPEATRAMCR